MIITAGRTDREGWRDKKSKKKEPPGGGRGNPYRRGARSRGMGRVYTSHTPVIQYDECRRVNIIIVLRGQTAGPTPCLINGNNTGPGADSVYSRDLFARAAVISGRNSN